MTETENPLWERFESAVQRRLNELGLAPYVDVDFRPGPTARTVMLDEIVATPVRHGYGSQALSAIVALADRWDVTLRLQYPDEAGYVDDPRTDTPGIEALADWYVRFGFETTEDGARRRPQPVEAQTPMPEG